MREFLLAGRSLAHRPAFAAAATITVAFGIAVTTAIFSLVDAVLLKPLPFPDPDRLVAVYEANPAREQRTSLIAPARLDDFARASRSFEALSGSYAENVTDTSAAEPERLAGRRVMPRYFDVFAMKPLAGRTFAPDEERAGGPTAVVVSEAFANRRFGGAAAVVGARLILGGAAFTIVGVMPAAFTTAPVDAWLPAQLSPSLLRMRDARFLGGVGRLKPGVSAAQAQADLDAVQQALGREYPATDKNWSAIVDSLQERRGRDYRRPLWLVFGAVSLLLLVAVANVAALMLIQLRRRSHELGIRAALGASRARIVATIAREAILVAAAGALLGVVGSAWIVRALAAAFSSVPRAADAAVDPRALAFSIAVSAGAALLFGIWPALHAASDRLTVGVDRARSGGRYVLQDTMAVAQVALSLLLASSAVVLLRSYDKLSHVDLGFSPEHVIAFHIGAAWNEDRSRVSRMQEQVLAELARQPGIVAAGFTNFLPASGATLRYQVRVDGASRTEDPSLLTVGERTITAGYLRALRVPLVAGSWCPQVPFESKATPTAMVNRRFADQYGGAAHIVGRHFQFDQQDDASIEIAGVVGNAAEDGPGAPDMPYVYACPPTGAWPDPDYVVRTAGDPAALLASVRGLVHRIAPERAVFGVTTLDRVLREALDQPRMSARLVTLFGAAALLLAAVGLYGSLMLVVVERTRELGVRLALGARPVSIVALVAGRAARLAGAGAAIGLGLVVAARPLLGAVVYGAAPTDAATLLPAIAVLLVTAIAAVAVPAMRAAATDPITAIRE